MKRELLSKVDFNFIRYANCWEDADILLQGLDPAPGARFLSIGSAGDNSFSLLATGAELVVAVDVNRIQLYLIELKKAAYRGLDHDEFLGFLGFTLSSNRYEIFNRVKKYLSNEARVYWETNINQVEAGIITQGKFERYFSFFRKRILPLIHSEKKIEQLFESKSATAQDTFYTQKWNNWRWRMFFRIFFSKAVMGKYGRDPEFLKQVKVPVSQFIFEKAEKQLRSVAAQKNYFLHFIHKGYFGENLPHYARKENFEKIKANIDKVILEEGFAQDFIKEYGPFDHMNLSNIFEYMNPLTFRSTAAELVNGCTDGGRLAYWNLMVPRRIADISEKVSYRQEISERLTSIDKGFFYNSFIIDQKQ